VATIITVHGTFDTDSTAAPAPGEGKWWQEDSSFHRSLRDLVEPDSGELKIRSFAWSGANSEEARWAAGSDLLKRLRALEAENEPYCLIGHSHGGSVIAHAMLRAVTQKVPLKNLSGWLAVATPFVEMKARRWLFSRISVWGKSAYLLAVGSLIWGLATITDYFRHLLSIWHAPQDVALYQIAMIALIPAVATLAVLKVMESPKLRVLKKLRRAGLDRSPLDKVTLLFHRNDEAISGLSAIKQVRFAPFSSRFAVPLLMFASIFIPLIGALIIASNADIAIGAVNIVRTIAGTAPLDEYDKLRLADPLIRTIEVGIYLVAAPAVTILSRLNTPPFQEHTILTSILSTVFFALGLLVWWLLVNLFVYIVALISSGISHALSALLNRLAKSQVQSAALGGDTIGEMSVQAASHPAWCQKRFRPLPEELEDEITKASDVAATQAIQRIRLNLNRLAFSEKTDVAEAVSDYLTWRELIHTTYFYNPRFVKLTAFSVAKSHGFRPSPSLRSDPDFGMVAQWHDQIMSDPSQGGR
jgi:hypothetical protein